MTARRPPPAQGNQPPQFNLARDSLSVRKRADHDVVHAAAGGVGPDHVPGAKCDWATVIGIGAGSREKAGFLSRQERLPNHPSCVKREQTRKIAKQVRDLTNGEGAHCIY